MLNDIYRLENLHIVFLGNTEGTFDCIFFFK